MTIYQASEQSLYKRVILITGASRGIGKTLALAAAKQGATVILLGRTVPALEKLYDEITAAKLPEPAIYPFNLTNAKPEDYDDLRINIDKNYGRLDGLVHNAGVLPGLTPLEYYPIENWYQILQVHLNGPFHLTQATIPLLKRSKDASIIFTIAKQGLLPKAHWGAYASANAGVQAFMQVLADEYQSHKNIRINSIVPDQVKTKLQLSLYPAKPDTELDSPSSIMPAYLYLLGSDSKAIHGKTIRATKDFMVEKTSCKETEYSMDSS